MTFQENHSNGSQDTFDRVLQSPSKYGVKENPYNRSRDAADEVGCGPHILLITVHRRITLEDGPDRLSRNVGNKLPISAAKHPRTARISHRGRS